MSTTTLAPITGKSLVAALATQQGTVADQITALYTANPDSVYTVKELTETLTKSRTTVTDNLKKLAEAGTVIRMDKDGVTTWSLTPTRKAAAKRAAKRAAQAKASKPKSFAKRLGEAERGMAEAAGLVKPRAAAKATQKGKTHVTTETAAPATTDDENRTATGRRKKGAIDGEILAWFGANGNEPAGSYAVAQGIGARAGSTYVALKRMADKEGTLVLVSTEPDRYAPTA